MQECEVASAFGAGHGALQQARIAGFGQCCHVRGYLQVPTPLAKVVSTGIALLALSASSVWGQNLTAGKTPIQLYAQSCVVCHGKPQTLGAAAATRSLDGFMRQHYTTSKEEAALMAAYVRGLASDPAAARQSRTATTRSGGTGPEPKAAPRAPKGIDQVRVPDDRAPPNRTGRQRKPDESRPVFDTSPPVVVPWTPDAPSSPGAAEKPTAEPTTPTAQAPARPEEAVRPEPEPAKPAAELSKEPVREPTREPAGSAAAPPAGAAPLAAPVPAPASDGTGAREAE